MKNYHHIKVWLAGLLLGSVFISAVMAEDIEIYTTSGAGLSGTKPNILFIVDGSSDMLATSAVVGAYDSSKSYTGAPNNCAADRIYFSTDGSLPVCSNTNDNYIDFAALACENAFVTEQFVLDANGIPTAVLERVDGPLLSSGTYSDKKGHYIQSGNGANATYAWGAVSITRNAHHGYTVECESDSGVHGETDASADTYIDDAGKYTNIAGVHPVWSDPATLLTLYHPNYINYRNDTTLVAGAVPYFEQIQNAIVNMVEGNTQVNIGLMVLDQQSPANALPISEGGGIMYQVQDGSLPRGNFIPQLLAINPEGNSPLSEAYYEALLYFGGKEVDYGTNSSPPLVGSATGAGNTDYISPIQVSCQSNYIVVASNGKAADDELDAVRQGRLPGFTAGSCSSNITPDDISDDNLNADNSFVATDDNCMDELAGWAANNDVATLSVDEHEGTQNITTHTLGFGFADSSNLDPQETLGKTLLQVTAARGKGDFYQADSQEEIEAAFSDIILNALKVNSTFSSPAVSVNAFNRSTHLDDMYFTLFKPTNGNSWDGNLKKYKLKFYEDVNDDDGDGDVTERLPFIADQNGAKAVDDNTGFFSDVAQSYWTTTIVDGKEVADGGAASRLTTTRRVYTYTGAYNTASGVSAPMPGGDLTMADNAIDSTNAALTDVLLNVVGKTEYILGTPYLETLINWASGLDALSDYGSTDTYNDVRPQYGDPLHSEPALVQYGGTSAAPDLVAFVATNDGYLHAVDVDDGTEIFSFVPQELLPNLQIAMENKGGDKLYGLDGNVVAWVNDANGDGKISGAGEHVYLYVGMRRGGKNIYALNVTNRNSPELLWVIKGGSGDYPELAQTWSTINVEKVKDGAAERTVLIFGGGYDIDQDNAKVRTADTEGRTVYIADATTGARLWTAGADAASPVAEMNYSIPARIKPLDISGDGYIDRLYAADMGGQIFRFDINNTNCIALSSSITGGRIADLAGATTTSARRFFYPPDVAIANAPDGRYHALIISSGYRAHPLDTMIQDRIYMFKDRNMSLVTTYPTADVLTEADLYNATDNIAGGNAATELVKAAAKTSIGGAEGWYIYLDDETTTNSWLGEKGLAEPLILEGMAIVTTYTPSLSPSPTSCVPSIGLGKAYYIDMLDATPAYPGILDHREERSVVLKRGGIPPTPNLIITQGGVPTGCIGTECEQANLDLGIRKTHWYEVEK
jgi:type IV pilus assembly protein PilY1